MSALRRAPARAASMRVKFKVIGAMTRIEGDVLMTITKKSTILVAAVAVASFISGAAYAQQAGNNDTLSHVSSPRADGQCWISTEKPVMENGYGYWGPCEHTTGSAVGSSAARRARAQAHGSINTEQ